MAQALYLKWRPQVWDDVVGQEHVTRILRNAIVSDRVHHAYLFAGPRGCGKTTTARLLAKAVNCLDPEPSRRPCNACAHCLAVNEGRFLDLIEIDGASNNSVEDVRDLRDKINFSPSQGRYKVYVVDECHMLSTGAFNALLKTLEEPPSHAIFVLATTEAHKIPVTVLSRCQRHDFRLISHAEMVARLKAVAAEEGMRAEETALEVVARHATGSLRDAISLLDQLAAAGDEITLVQAQSLLGAAASQAVLDLVDALAERDSALGLALINQTIDAGAGPRQFARQIVETLRRLVLIKMGRPGLMDITDQARATLERQAERFEIGELLRAVRAFNSAAAELRAGWQPQLPLELAFVEVALAEASSVVLPPVSKSPSESSPDARRGLPNPRHAIGFGNPSGAFQTAAKDPELANSPSGVETSNGQSRAKEPAKTSIPSQETHPPGTPVENEPQAHSAFSTTAPASVAGVPHSAFNPPPPGQGPEGAVSFSALLKSWKDLAIAVRNYDPLTQGLLNSCTPMGLEDSVLLLGFASEVLRAKMEKGEHIANLRRALIEVLGRELQVKCVLAGRDRKVQPAAGELPDDGMAATALRELGAQVVDIQ